MMPISNNKKLQEVCFVLIRINKLNVFNAVGLFRLMSYVHNE